jgi:hypothetical protein
MARDTEPRWATRFPHIAEIRNSVLMTQWLLCCIRLPGHASEDQMARSHRNSCRRRRLLNDAAPCHKRVGLRDTVHDPKRDCRAPIAAGASPACLPAEVAEYADIVVVNSAAEAAEFLFDEGGIGDTLRLGGWVIDVSRTQPVHARAWSWRLASYGIGLLVVVVVVDAESSAAIADGRRPPIDEDVVAPVLSALGPARARGVTRCSRRSGVAGRRRSGRRPGSGYRGGTDRPITRARPRDAIRASA